MTISSDYQGRKGEQGNIHVHCQLLSNSVVITLIIWTYSTSQMTSWAPLVHISLLLHGWILTLSHRGASASLDRGSSGRAGYPTIPCSIIKMNKTSWTSAEMNADWFLHIRDASPQHIYDHKNETAVWQFEFILILQQWIMWLHQWCVRFLPAANISCSANSPPARPQPLSYGSV